MGSMSETLLPICVEASFVPDGPMGGSDEAAVFSVLAYRTLVQALFRKRTCSRRNVEEVASSSAAEAPRTSGVLSTQCIRGRAVVQKRCHVLAWRFFGAITLHAKRASLHCQFKGSK